ncbi:MAG: hypothetical protein IH827_04330, partial [Myxococcales bacterium]|nr:hypothetical protein [Myxococcales bacterium]
MKIAVIAGGRRKTLLLVTGIVAATLVAACMSLEWKPIGPRRTEAVAGATAVGSDECSVCHAVVQGFEKIASYHGNCESCHGPGSLHSNSEALQEIRYPANQDCLVCHVPGRDSHLQWSTGAHSRADLYCSDCHNPHSVRPDQATRNRGTRGLLVPLANRFVSGVSAGGVRLENSKFLYEICFRCHADNAARRKSRIRRQVYQTNVRLEFQTGAWRQLEQTPPAKISLIPRETYYTDTISRAILHVAQGYLDRGELPRPLAHFLERRAPAIAGHEKGSLVRS